jgi:hypothetical protein
MKVTVRLTKDKSYICNVKESNQLDAAAASALKGQFYGLMPALRFATQDSES